MFINNIYNIDYIDLDYGIIGAYYSTGMTGASNGGNNGYVLMKFQYTDANLKKPQNNCLAGTCDTESYKIVGSQEADPFNNKISNESPIAAAIIGKKVGDTVEVASPDGVYSVKIVAIG